MFQSDPKFPAITFSFSVSLSSAALDRTFKITYLGTRPAYITWLSPLRDSLKQNSVNSDLEVGENFKLLFTCPQDFLYMVRPFLYKDQGN